MLGSAPERDRDSGAIRLELIPARQLEEVEPSAPPSQDEERKVAYVDHVVQEILETERTYVQDLQSIVQVREGGREGGVIAGVTEVISDWSVCLV